MKFARHIAYFLLLLVITPLMASAQESNGKFTVSHETHWGSATLPAGRYSVAIHSGPVPYVLVTSEDRATTSIMAVARYMESAQCKNSSLELEQADGSWNVRSLCLASSLAVYFGPSQKMTQTKVASSPAAASLAAAN